MILNALHVLRLMRRRRQIHTTTTTPAPDHSALTNSPSTASHPRPQTLSLPVSPSSQRSLLAPNSRVFEPPRNTTSPLSSSDPEPSSALQLPCTCNPLCPAWLKILTLTALPWVVSMVTIVPLVLFNASLDRMYSLQGDYMLEDVMCMLILPRPVLLTATFLSLYLPFYLCVTALVTLIICHSRLQRLESHSYHHPSLHPDHIQSGFQDDSRQERREGQIPNGRAQVRLEDGDSDMALQPHLPCLDVYSSPPEVQQTALSSSTPLIENIGQDRVLTENLSSSGNRNYPTACLDGRGVQDHMSPSCDMRVNDSDSLLALCLPNAVYLMCYTPLLVHTWLHLSGVYTPDRAYFLALFFLLSRSFLMPISWFVFPDIRQEASENWEVIRNFLASICSSRLCCYRSRGLTSSASSVTFSRLQENPAV